MAGIAAASAIERALLVEGRSNIAGCDEAGRGALAGPLIAAACVLDYNDLPEILADSKSLNAARRDEAAVMIKDRALAWAVSTVGIARLDRINVLNASLAAMASSLERVDQTVGIQAILADGQFLPDARLSLQTASRQAVIDGDAKCACIAAASILAKTARDALMRKYAQRFPQYGFDRNMGYGTPEHLAALREHGPCELHRRSFKPVRACIEPSLFD